MLIWKVLKGEVEVPPAEVGLHQAARPDRGPDPNPLKLNRQGGKDTSSPLWRATSVRTIQDFNNLPGTLVEADDAGTFSNGLDKMLP